ncbi:hypothetical protein V6N12_047409 [Hibiscus sabdariffa]|uniref:Uncharacterized protein n=1 Tax=Hibiscus sabdariffa TaxID=183260 RepID=A0ABR2DAS2_9ROSI
MDYNEEVTDEFQGVKVWWSSKRTLPSTQQIALYPNDDEKRSYKLTVHNYKRHRELITQSYVSHVIKEGRKSPRKTGNGSFIRTIRARTGPDIEVTSGAMCRLNILKRLIHWQWMPTRKRKSRTI